MPQFAAPAEPSVIEQLPAEVRDGFAQVLAALTGSKVLHPSIACMCFKPCLVAHALMSQPPT